jgi:predicted subunit of tRNA(5-methylaminomethyl-2-thiouridylate) methyltransferase
VIDQGVRALPFSVVQAFEDRHFPIAYWARLWGFSTKTVREWFRDEFGPGILRQQNTGRVSRRDYITTMVSASAAARVYAKRTAKELIH